MTSLVLTHYRPHRPTSGAPLRNWQNIRALSAFGPVDVVTVGVEDAAEPVDGVRQWVPFSLRDRSRLDRVRTACAPLRPAVNPGIDLYDCAPVRSWLQRRGAEAPYDVAVIETVAMAAYVDTLRQCARRVVFDAHNVEGALQAALTARAPSENGSLVHRLKLRELNRRMAAAERRVVRRADQVWACSDTDAEHIAHLYGRRTGIAVVPNGVDVDAYRRPGVLPPGSDWGCWPVTMIYPGLFSYAPNEQAALRLVRAVLPIVRARGYDARVVLVGRDPTPALLDAARRDDGVEVTGSVESILPFLEQPCVVTLPIAAGSGTRLKIIEAFAVGRPVVSTSKGVEGISARDGEHLLIRDDPGAIAEAVVSLWTCPPLRARLCTAALALARDTYSWTGARQRIAACLGLGPCLPSLS